MTRKLWMVCILVGILFMAGCIHKSRVVCLEYMDGGHGTAKASAGAWGDVIDINMTGPNAFSMFNEHYAHNPCKVDPAKPAKTAKEAEEEFFNAVP